MNDTPTTSPTAPSAGAVRAAIATYGPLAEKLYKSGDKVAIDLVNERAAIIDRETRAKELLAALAPFARLHNAGFEGTVWEGRDDSCDVFFHHASGVKITLGDFRKSAELIAKEGRA